MSSPIYTTPASASPLAVDSDDPNTTAPNDLRTFVGSSERGIDASAVYAIPVGGAATLQLWGRFDKRWAKIGSATDCAADTVTTLGTPPVGTSLLCVQVTVNTACTKYSLGFMGSR